LVLCLVVLLLVKESEENYIELETVMEHSPLISNNDTIQNIDTNGVEISMEHPTVVLDEMECIDPKTCARRSDMDEEIEVIPSFHLNVKAAAQKHIRSFIPPIIYWLPKYDKAKLRGDIVAGVTVGVVLIPQGMAYGALAGLPPIYGLYASVIPPLIYALFGSSMQLSIGPVALTAILTASGVNSLGIPHEEHDLRIEAAIALGLVCGLILIMMGALNIGFIVNFFSNTVLSAFISAAAIIIVASQLEYIFGVFPEKSQSFAGIMYNTLSKLPNTSWQTVLGSVLCFAVLIGSKYIKNFPKWLPIELVVMVGGTLLGYLVDLHVVTVGYVPSGLPIPRIPNFDGLHINLLFIQGFIIALVSYIGSIALAKTFAFRHSYDIDATQEFIAIGMAGFIGAFFSGHPVSGSFSRTAVNNEMGARSPLASVITGLVVALFLIFLTPVFQYLPKLILACIVVLSVRNLIDYKEARYLWRVSKGESFVFYFTFVCTLFVGIDTGILISVVVSLASVIFRSSMPRIAILGETTRGVYRNVDRFPYAKQQPGIVIMRLEADLFFVNIAIFKDKIHELQKQDSIRAFIVDGSTFNYLDPTSCHVLETIIDDLRKKEIKFAFAQVRASVRDTLRQAGITPKLLMDPKLRIEDAILRLSSLATE